MKQYVQEIELYFELKGTSDSSRESYRRSMRVFYLSWKKGINLSMNKELEFNMVFGTHIM